jgi:hypothetical protein
VSIFGITQLSRNFPCITLPNTYVFSANTLFGIFFSEFLVETSTQMNRWLLPDAQSVLWPSGRSRNLSARQADEIKGLAIIHVTLDEASCDTG